MRPQLWRVPLQHRAQAVIRNPFKARRRIGLRREIGGKEAVAFEPPGSHQDEDAESRIGKAEARRRFLTMHADDQIDLVDGLVDGGELALPIGIGGELGEALRHAHAEPAAKRAIARHAALAIAQHVGRGHIDEDVVLFL